MAFFMSYTASEVASTCARNWLSIAFVRRSIVNPQLTLIDSADIFEARMINLTVNIFSIHGLITFQ